MIYAIARFEPKEDITAYELAMIIDAFIQEHTGMFANVATTITIDDKIHYEKFKSNRLSRHFNILKTDDLEKGESNNGKK